MYETLNDLYDVIPWDALDAVVFDVGNVLLTFQPPRILEQLFPGDAELQAQLTARVFRSPYWPMLDHGLLDNEAAEALMSRQEPSLRPAIRQLLHAWPALMEPMPEGIAALRTVKERGKKAFVLSNFHREAFAEVSARHAFFRLFDGLLVSARVKLLKPNPAIYRCLTETFGQDPARLLFIDDTPMNIEAALACGWQGLCYDRPGRISAFLGGGD